MNSDPAAIAYHPAHLNYDFGPQHPLRPERLSAGLSLLESSGLWSPDSETLTCTHAAQSDLELVHDSAYIYVVEELGTGWFPGSEARRYGFGSADNPPFPHMHHAAAAVVGASAAAARSIMSGHIAHAFNPGGGLHHAMQARAAGFCIYNDPAVAAAIAVKEFGARVLYLDFDCHHGDGVQAIFYDAPEVVTVSFHETGRYLFPGTGFADECGQGEGHGASINVPFEPYTQDASWIEITGEVVRLVAARVRPDFVVSAHGADTHVWDPLTHLALTTASLQHQARLAHEVAHEHADGRWLAVGSGGYDWRRVVPRSYAILWSEMTGRTLPDHLPETWVRQWSPGAEEPFPDKFMDSDVCRAGPRACAIEQENRASCAAALKYAGLP